MSFEIELTIKLDGVVVVAHTGEALESFLWDMRNSPLIVPREDTEDEDWVFYGLSYLPSVTAMKRPRYSLEKGV